MKIELLLQQFVECEAKSCPMDFGCITPLYVYRMCGCLVPLIEIEEGWKHIKKEIWR